MNKTIILIISILCLCIHNIMVSANSIPIKSIINRVIIYKEGAKVFRNTKINIEKGMSSIRIESLPSNIDEQSIRILKKGECSIQSFQFDKKQLPPVPFTIRKEIQEVNNLIQKEKLELEVILNEIKEIKTFFFSSSSLSDRKESIKELYKFYTDLSEEHNAKISKKNEKIEKGLIPLKDSLNRIIDSITFRTQHILGYIDVDVQSDQDTEVEFQIEYLVSAAGWEPKYSVNAKSNSESLSVILMADIHQNTHENWNNIDVTLSTANPYTTFNIENLKPIYLSFYHQYSTEIERGSYLKSMVMNKMANENYNYSNTVSNDISQVGSNVEISLHDKYSINSHNANITLDIDTTILPAKFTYVCTPKLVSSAYLTASIVDWKNEIKLPAKANISFDGSISGKTYLNPFNGLDTLTIPFGDDFHVKVNRTMKSSLAQSKQISGKKVQKRSWIISLSNMYQKEINVTIYDQIPLSKEIDILVKPLNIDGILDTLSGIVRWDVHLNSEEKKLLHCEYEVSHPKNKEVILE